MMKTTLTVMLATVASLLGAMPFEARGQVPGSNATSAASVQAFADAKPEYNERNACPEGNYSGARAGARGYAKDPYRWFITPVFAKRFCMPTAFVAADLQGALAIAVRTRPHPLLSCGVLADGSEECIPKADELLLDVYLDNT